LIQILFFKILAKLLRSKIAVWRGSNRCKQQPFSSAETARQKLEKCERQGLAGIRQSCGIANGD
jgi:hypothetical protein